MKILYIAKFDLPDYQSDMIFHGLRSLFGENCVDVVDAWYMYDDMRQYWCSRVPENGNTYGRGFTIDGKLPRIDIDRTDLLSKIKNHYFDKIVYGSITRCMDYIDIVKDVYKREDVIIINGEDNQDIQYQFLPIGKLFKRELNSTDTNVSPINFCIPKELIVKSIPNKTQDYATVVPGNHHTYIYKEEKIGRAHV